MTKTIKEVVLRKVLDEDPDLSWLGEYGGQWKEGAIDRFPDFDPDVHPPLREYRYFYPVRENYAGDPDIEKYVQQDYDRMEAYNRQDWCMVGIYAEARLVVEGVLQTVRSPGLWGIESDSEEGHFKEVADEELGQLKAVLKELGFSQRAIAQATEDPEWKEV